MKTAAAYGLDAQAQPETFNGKNLDGAPLLLRLAVAGSPRAVHAGKALTLVEFLDVTYRITTA